MHRKARYVFLAVAITALYLVVLQRYGTAIPAAIPPEEINFAALAKSIAEGRGAIYTVPSEIVPAPERTPRRVYVPVLSYAFALSGWGRIWGFGLLALRWLSRFLGAVNLLLLIKLARRWGVPEGVALWMAFWTSMDILYQLDGNLVRPEMFTLFWSLLGLLAFSTARERDEPVLWLASGVCFTVALFAHLWLAVYLALWLGFVLLWEKRSKALALFALPFLGAGMLWLWFVLQDWAWFRALSRMMIADKAPQGRWVFWARLLGVQIYHPPLGLYPSNAPLWAGVALAFAWAAWRGAITLPFWQQGVLLGAYWTAFTGGSMWYGGWFTPLGYLGVAVFAAQALLPKAGKGARTFLLVLALGWSLYQGQAVVRCWTAAPTIHAAHQVFFRELEADLPPRAAIGLQSIPDPSFYLSEARPDLRLYVASGYSSQLRFFQQLDGVIATPGLLRLDSLPSYRIVRWWRLPSVEGKYIVLWIRLLPPSDNPGAAARP